MYYIAAIVARQRYIAENKKKDDLINSEDEQLTH